MEREEPEELVQDPLLNIFEDGIQQFVQYERQNKEGYRTRTEKHREKLQKLYQHFNSEEHKKQRNKQRRNAQKKRINKVMQTMNEQEAKKFIKENKQKRKLEKARVKQAMKTGQVIMVDLVYEDKMGDKQNKSLAKQIQLIMKSIKHVEDPPSIHLCSFGGLVKGYLEAMGYQHLPFTTHLENIYEVGEKLGKKLVYLSPDAEEPLEKVQKDTAYILGGLIDRSIIKNASLIRANNLGIEAKRLPIRQYMKNRTVLNLDHVTMMVMNYRETNDWKKSFDFAAPKRWKRQQKEEQSEEQKQQADLIDQKDNQKPQEPV